MTDKNIEAIIREYIEKTPHMSLATVSDNKPWVCEVHFIKDDDLNLYFISKQTTRHCQEISVNPFVAGNIVRQHPLDESPIGVYFEGQAEKINATEDDIENYCTAMNRNISELTEQLKEQDGRRMYRVVVSNWAIFGNFNGKGHMKYEFDWVRK